MLGEVSQQGYNIMRTAIIEQFKGSKDNIPSYYMLTKNMPEIENMTIYYRPLVADTDSDECGSINEHINATVTNASVIIPRCTLSSL